jgi:hypothetical protein
MRPTRLLPILVLPLSSWLGGCGGGEEGLPAAEVALARDRAAQLGARGAATHWAEARELLAPLVKAKDAPLEDLVRAANAQLALKEEDDRIEKALPLIERAAALDPHDPVVLWLRYQVAAIEYDLEKALPPLRELHRLRPDDFHVTLALASTLDDLDASDETEAEAQQLYAELLAIPKEVFGSWRVTVLYKYGTSLRRSGRDEEAEPLYEELNLLTAQGVEQPGIPTHEPDTLGGIPPQTPRAGAFTVAVEPYAPRLAQTAVAARAEGARPFRATRGVITGDIGESRDGEREELFTWTPPPVGILTWDAQGLRLDGTRLHEGPVRDALPFDRKNVVQHKADDKGEPRPGDSDTDLLVAVPAGDGTALHLFENVGGTWTWKPEPLATLPPLGPGALMAVDFDHDGDVDVLAASDAGPRLLRNDGIDSDRGALTDVTTEAGLVYPSCDVIPEDLDGDNDVDFLLVERGSGIVHLADNLRGGNFADASNTLPAGLRREFPGQLETVKPSRLVVADFDADGRPDVFQLFSAFSGHSGIHGARLYTRTELGGWAGEPRDFPVQGSPSGPPVAVDLDLDGTTDVVWPCQQRTAAVLLAPGFEGGGLEATLGDEFDRREPAELFVLDLDGDHDLDFLRRDQESVTSWKTEGTGRGAAFALFGHKDNAIGLGAIVELRAGLAYRRTYYHGEPQLVGFGGRPIDHVRITWPNGVLQGDDDFAPGSSTLIAQRKGLAGSCPFLYTWNGTTYEFISDVLGITPLGLPMAPGMMVPPDHDEFVLVKGEQLVPKDGVYEIQLTEELREVTYLDRVRLDVVDHPADTEIFPEERFSFPPFPPHHVHSVADPLTPLTAVDGTGRSWKRELTKDDRSFAIPFEALPGPFSGLATPHVLELTFDAEAVRTAPKLRLVMNGWFYWSDASVNVSAARHPDHAFVPPILSVPDGEGGWRECGPIGFPAGKLKTMVVDVSDLLNRDEPSLRLFSTIRVYWDSIRLAVDADDGERRVTAIEPTSADLWQRGFSRSQAILGEHDCEWFTWDELEPEPRWNQHPGLYTRLGETLPLVSEIDDQFVILGAGDALTVRFDASKAPPLPAGWRRDFLVFLDGWAKDRDPNTLEALYVEPLPFHGMSGYPYRSDEHYPDDEAHRAYQREWNTRPARRWIEPLATGTAVAE